MDGLEVKAVWVTQFGDWLPWTESRQSPLLILHDPMGWLSPFPWGRWGCWGWSRNNWQSQNSSPSLVNSKTCALLQGPRCLHRLWRKLSQRSHVWQQDASPHSCNSDDGWLRRGLAWDNHVSEPTRVPATWRSLCIVNMQSLIRLCLNCKISIRPVTDMHSVWGWTLPPSEKHTMAVTLAHCPVCLFHCRSSGDVAQLLLESALGPTF